MHLILEELSVTNCINSYKMTYIKIKNKKILDFKWSLGFQKEILLNDPSQKKFVVD